MTKVHLTDSGAHTLLTHLISCPGIAQDLKLVREIALDPSCEVLLGPEEKSALLNVQELATRMEGLSENGREELRSLL